MVRNALNKFVKVSSRKFRPTTFERRMMVMDSIMNDQKNKDYNPRRARSKSLKGIMFTNK